MPICKRCNEDKDASELIKTPDGYLCPPCIYALEDEEAAANPNEPDAEVPDTPPETFTCAKCQKTVTEVPSESTIGKICENCSDRCNYTCECCDRIIIGKKKTFEKGSDEWYCEDCVAKNLTVCTTDDTYGCGDRYPKAELKEYTAKNGKTYLLCPECYDYALEIDAASE